MKPEFINGNVRANCPECNGAVTTFDHALGGMELGALVRDQVHDFDGYSFFPRLVSSLFLILTEATAGRISGASIDISNRGCLVR
jgi:hypothetical protein